MGCRPPRTPAMRLPPRLLAAALLVGLPAAGLPSPATPQPADQPATPRPAGRPATPQAANPAYPSEAGTAAPASGTVPSGSAWLQYATPEGAGWSSSRLREARSLVNRVGSGAVMAVHRGRVVLAWGDVERKFRCHSVRKSFLSALYGIHVAEGTIDLEETLEELAIDDVHRLTAAEKRARVVDLLRARSGVYHPSAYSPRSMEENLPPRGSHPPDTHWYYNNWDFNTLGEIFERETGTDIFAEFEARIARPLGMQDFRASDGFDVLEPSKSRYPAYTFRMSTRDMARFGQLFLQGGRWQGRQIVPARWVEESTALHSAADPGGYGYMWWVYPAGSFPRDLPHLRRHDSYAAQGSGGQLILVIPAEELVIVHRGDTDLGRPVSGPDVWRVAERILAAKVGAAREDPELVRLAPVPFRDRLPAPASQEPVRVDPALYGAYAGVYEFAPGLRGRVYVHGGNRLFLHLPGEGEGELLPTGETRFFLGVLPSVTVEFQDDGKRVRGLVVRMPDGSARRALRLP